MTIADSIRQWLWRGADPLLDELSRKGEKLEAEIVELKKLVRRQGIQQEALVRDISTKIDTLAFADGVKESDSRPDSLMELAETFFHLQTALVHLGIEHETLEALEIVWEKLGEVCNEVGLEIILESGVPFDSRMHEALDRAPAGEHPVVKDVTAPGFIHDGRVIRPARVMLSENTISDLLGNEVINGK
jgi:molecular chaperone GrpE (heat shock protein)